MPRAKRSASPVHAGPDRPAFATFSALAFCAGPPTLAREWRAQLDGWTLTRSFLLVVLETAEIISGYVNWPAFL